MKINQQRIAEIINKGGRGDRASRQFDLALSILIIANILAVSLESVSTLGNKFGCTSSFLRSSLQLCF